MAIEALASDIAASAFGQAMRSSSWAYPLANVGHLFGLALLAGGIMAVDLRIMGFWRNLPLKPIHDALTPFAIAGLVIFAISGVALFAADARELIRNPVFVAKMAIVALAATNALAFRKFAVKALGKSGANLALGLRMSATISLCLWSAAIICGRMIAY
ncbi:MAG: hypothetical protein IBJ12_09550 [Sphingomonadaceae bacterium]|nr:hypothetical protein [Sphingomonadaceae bacterium]